MDTEIWSYLVHPLRLGRCLWRGIGGCWAKLQEHSQTRSIKVQQISPPVCALDSVPVVDPKRKVWCKAETPERWSMELKVLQQRDITNMKWPSQKNVSSTFLWDWCLQLVCLPQYGYDFWAELQSHSVNKQSHRHISSKLSMSELIGLHLRQSYCDAR